MYSENILNVLFSLIILKNVRKYLLKYVLNICRFSLYISSMTDSKPTCLLATVLV